VNQQKKQLARKALHCREEGKSKKKKNSRNIELLPQEASRRCLLLDSRGGHQGQESPSKKKIRRKKELRVKLVTLGPKARDGKLYHGDMRGEIEGHARRNKGLTPRGAWGARNTTTTRMKGAGKSGGTDYRQWKGTTRRHYVLGLETKRR